MKIHVTRVAITGILLDVFAVLVLDRELVHGRVKLRVGLEGMVVGSVLVLLIVVAHVPEPYSSRASSNV